MSLAPVDAAFASRLALPKDALVSDHVEQLGARAIRFDDAPDWPTLDGLDDDVIIETFLVDADGRLTPLSESPALVAWQPRAEAMAHAVITTCAQHAIAIEFPAYITGSITPVELLEGNPHLDDDQLVPGAGLGLVAINGQHVGPRVAERPLALDRVAAPGPLPLQEAAVEQFRNAGVPAGQANEIAVLAQFGQLHAGPNSEAINDATHRQLLVLRAGTTVASPSTGRP